MVLLILSDVTVANIQLSLSNNRQSDMAELPLDQSETKVSTATNYTRTRPKVYSSDLVSVGQFYSI